MRGVPRRPLGSALYATTVAPRPTDPSDPSAAAAAAAATAASPPPYVSDPVPIPLFAAREGGTFVVRVPPAALAAARRREVGARRALWGADVYTDDSDPLAAAVHAGWLRGAWPPDVDEHLLALPGSLPAARQLLARQTVDPAPAIAVEAPPASGPMLPVPRRELQLSLLVLPRLERYAGVIRNGVRSREWTGRHDGLSFMIETVAWVEERHAREVAAREEVAARREREREERRRKRRRLEASACREEVGKGPGLETGVASAAAA